MDSVVNEQVEIEKEIYYKIGNSDMLRPFFMSIVSDSNHWMFISSNGGLTAGRKNAEHALFPYSTDDKITESAEYTGSKTLFQVEKAGEQHLWEPFSIRNEGKYNVTRNLYKNRLGNKVLFEEVNDDLEVSYRYEWCSSNVYGFVRKSTLINHSSKGVKIRCVDGIQNIMPFGVPSDLQNSGSNLVNAYKRNEIHEDTGLGMYALSAIIVDRAEPSEALKANAVWSLGLDAPKYLLSSLQLKEFRDKGKVHQETDIKGERGAYFIYDEIELSEKGEKKWIIIADVNQSQSKVFELIHRIQSRANLYEEVLEDIELGSKNLLALIASADGLQNTADSFRDGRHYANVLFNIMRGGIFDDNYKIERWDFLQHIEKANKQVYRENYQNLNALAETFTLQELRALLSESTDNNLRRLAMEYLPIKFSRRHGDPSRPWNRFSINMIDEKDGSKLLDYEGNWRDIFQNWEALVHAYPDFIEGMIFRFLNASTFDGYNPYRITKDGFDWETIEPDDPWSYIGYWGDHQIIYLLKFLEFIEKHNPGKLSMYFDQNIFVYANVPYEIKSHDSIVQNPKDTIIFNAEADHQIRKYREEIGGDGALLKDENGQIHQVNFIEKILATVLAKISNFVPEGGIWMNTQRPEWNDANNALVGNGISMVTLYYLRRFLKFFLRILERSELENMSISNELLDFYKQVRRILEDNQSLIDGKISDEDRKMILDQLGTAASEYRNHIYKQSFWGKKRSISKEGLMRFMNISLAYIDHTIKANKRSDGLYHAYNLLTIDEGSLRIAHLSEMLEGQVAVLSSQLLKPEEALSVLDGMKNSPLFRPDQYSYLLYPNKKLPGFLEKNNVPHELVQESQLLQELLAAENKEIIEKDVFGNLHFNGNFRNITDVQQALDNLDKDMYGKLITQDKVVVEHIFESVFNHKAFTGRSGTFYGYEGLGSIYWHMVSKLLLAVQETCCHAIRKQADPSTIGRLLDHFYEINEGIGVHKSPELYGAFSTDPYSHTPYHKGAQQPGMTGQVKEDILSRFGELGVIVHGGKLFFNPCLLRKNEFRHSPSMFNYIDVLGEYKSLNLKANTLAFTYCQVPVVYTKSTQDKLILRFKDGSTHESESLSLDLNQSDKIFKRTAEIISVEVEVNELNLK